MGRFLIVIENKKTEDQLLWDPFAKGHPVVPEGYYKITQTMPLDEEKFGDLPLYVKRKYSRIDVIKSLRNDPELLEEHLDWLIEQAEKAERLEEILSHK